MSPSYESTTEAADAVYDAVASADVSVDVDRAELQQQIEGELELFDITISEAADIIKEATIEQAQHGPRYTESGLYTDDGPAGSPAGEVSDSDSSASPSRVRTRSIETLTPEETVTVDATVVSLWAAPQKKVQQRGIIADSTGYQIFTTWENGRLPTLDVGCSYRFQTAVTDKQAGEILLNCTPRSTIAKIEDTIEQPAADYKEELGRGGAILGVESPSGLIGRCNVRDCTNALVDGVCETHGIVEDSVTDLRIKAYLDDGETVTRVIYNRPLVEDLLGVTLSGYQSLVATGDQTEREVLERRLLGKQQTVVGIPFGEALMVGEYHESEPGVPASISPSEPAVAPD